jgi:murein DD-endopeptidase MepM/ murein hydrolase activator NlpD
VIRASDGSPDRQQLSLLRDLWAMIFSRLKLNPDDIRSFAGNHVIIQGEGFYVFLAHMQCGSVQVREGDEVEVGQLIGRIGNSGFTLEPHLHFQLFAQIDNLLAATVPPFLVKEYERWTGERWELVSNAVLQKGDLIRSLRDACDP